MNEILTILRNLRVGVTTDEYTLQNQISDLLQTSGVSFTKEHKLGRGSRVDILTSCGTAIEIKKGKSYKAAVHNQLYRYAEYEEITGYIADRRYGAYEAGCGKIEKEVRVLPNDDFMQICL